MTERAGAGGTHVGKMGWGIMGNLSECKGAESCDGGRLSGWRRKRGDGESRGWTRGATGVEQGCDVY